MLMVNPSELFILNALAADGRTDLFARAKIYNSSNSLVNTISLPHVTVGSYATTTSLATEGYYTVLYQFFLDAGFTQPADYGKTSEAIDVNSMKSNVMRILGLLHENSLIDMNSYDGNGNLLSARIRVYDGSVNLAAASAISPAAYVTGQLYEYTVSATYAGDLLTKYSITRVM